MKIENLVIPSFVLMLSGAFLLKVSLVSIESSFVLFYPGIWISTLCFSLGLLLSYKVSQLRPKYIGFFICIVYILALTMLLVYSFRFPVLSGSDILQEYVAARETLAEKRWPIDLQGPGAPESYFTSSAVTILPAILSEITGMDLLLVFKYLLQIVGASLVVFIFLAVREVFNDRRVACVSAILYAESFYFFDVFHSLVKQQISTILLMAVLYLILKDKVRTVEVNSARFKAISLMLMFGVIANHYTMVYFSILLFLVIAF